MENAKIAGSRGVIGPAAGIGGSEVLSLTGDKSKTDREKIGILSKEFESLFLNRMISSMRASVQPSGLLSGGPAEKMFTGMLDEQLARQMSFSQSGGLSDALERQLVTKMGLDNSNANNDSPGSIKNRYSGSAPTPIEKATVTKKREG